QIPRWKKWPVLFHTVPVAVFRRPDYVAGRGVGKAAQRFSRSWHPASRAGVLAGLKAPAWVLVNNRLNKISATSIRNGNKN
ncbi:nucleotidyl transferase family protein, partial [Parvimonas micra]|uniref:hypothetical protein n=1 Tax=Parvimonas micra TaxID=33033 RepID=UPI002B46593E